MDRFTMFLFFLLGVSFLFMDEYSFRGTTLKTADYPEFKFFGILLSIVSLYIIFKMKNVSLDKKNIEYSKCPKCKEVFTYNELKNVKCKHCADTDTIDINEYFKKYPEE